VSGAVSPPALSTHREKRVDWSTRVERVSGRFRQVSNLHSRPHISNSHPARDAPFLLRSV